MHRIVRKPLPPVWSLFLACALIACRVGHAYTQVQGVTARQDATALQVGAQQQEAPDYNGANTRSPQKGLRRSGVCAGRDPPPSVKGC